MTKIKENVRIIDNMFLTTLVTIIMLLPVSILILSNAPMYIIIVVFVSTIIGVSIIMCYEW